VPVFLWAILAEHDVIALVTLMLSGVSDYLDGKIARRFGLVSRAGQLLDPLADRLYIATTLFGLAWRDIIPWWLVLVLVTREVLLAVVLSVLKRYGQTGLPVHFVGKAATFNLLYAFPLLLLGDGESTFAQWALPIGWAFAWWGTVLYWLAGVMYIIQAWQVVVRARAASAAA
jgi:cardiolipin synthase (CMP-forming)